MRFVLLLVLTLIQANAAQEQVLNRGQALVKLLRNQPVDLTEKYADEYLAFNPMIRYPQLIEKSQNWWYFENFRNGILVSKQSDLSRARWTSAVVDTSKVKRAALLFGKFRNTSLNLGHLFSLFEFAENAVHLPQEKSLNHLVISFEAMRARGEKYSMWDGAWSRYGACFVVGSFADVLQKAALFYAGMEIYYLDLNATQLKFFLEKSLMDSMNISELKQERYNTIKNSCVTRQFDLLNSVLEPESRLKTWWNFLNRSTMRTWQSFWPGHTRQSLMQMGVFKSQEIMSDRVSIENRLTTLNNTQR